ncbi:uncharacterized protein LOC115214310, partial [Argonauta hians]
SGYGAKIQELTKFTSNLVMSAFLKNIYFFAKILHQASTEEVATWDKVSLQNAFHWASYCQEIYYQVIEKPYKDQFNQQIVKLNSVLSSPVLCGQLELQFLSQATDHLRHFLLFNNQLPEELFEEVIISSIGQKEVIINQCSELSNIHASLHILSQLERDVFSSLSCETQPDDSGVNMASVVTVKADMLWQRILNQMSHITDEDRLNQLVWNVICKLPDSKHGWETLLCLLMKKDVNVDTQLWNISIESYSKVFQTIEEFVQKTIRESKPPSLVWSVPEELLSQAVQLSFPLFTACLHHLVDWAKQFSPDYYEKPTQQLSYTWKFEEPEEGGGAGGCAITFKELCRHFLILSRCGDQPQAAVVAVLKYLLTDTSCSIWHDIYTTISAKH